MTGVHLRIQRLHIAEALFGDVHRVVDNDGVVQPKGVIFRQPKGVDYDGRIVDIVVDSIIHRIGDSIVQRHRQRISYNDSIIQINLHIRCIMN